MQDQNDRVVQALDTIVRSVVGQELESIRGSVDELRADLCRRIDGIKEETAGRLEDSKRELCERLEALERRLGEAETSREQALAGLGDRTDEAVAELQRKLGEAETSREQALAGLGDRTDEAVAELQRRLEAVQVEAKSRDEATRTALERDLETADRGFKEHLDGLSCKLTSVEQGLREQMETSERLAAVLSNLGNIFSAQAAVVTAEPAQATLSEAEERKELENALDKVFPVGS